MFGFGGGEEKSGEKNRGVGEGRLGSAPSFDLRTAIQIPALTNRRTQDEVKRLVYHFKLFIESTPGARDRLVYFWTDRDAQEGVLALVAEHIPRDADPLLPLRPSEGEEEEEEEEEETARRRRRRKKKYQNTQGLGDCVTWLGLVNKLNRYAAIRLKLPETYDPWITYTNRLMVYLFAEIEDYHSPDDFHRLLNVPFNEPFLMKCRNP
ncbi:hypothetical protein CSUI_001441, partial [Cystoisospora suis]